MRTLALFPARHLKNRKVLGSYDLLRQEEYYCKGEKSSLEDRQARQSDFRAERQCVPRQVGSCLSPRVYRHWHGLYGDRSNLFFDTKQLLHSLYIPCSFDLHNKVLRGESGCVTFTGSKNKRDTFVVAKLEEIKRTSGRQVRPIL